MLEALKTFSRILLMAALLNSFLYSDACSQENVTPEQFTQDFDYLWSQLRDNYAYFDKKQTDWNRVKEVYRPKVAEVRNEREFVTLLERVLDELCDPHTHLKVNTNRSTRLIPTGLDVWAERKNGKAIITQLRRGFSAEQAGLEVGMEIVSINGYAAEKLFHMNGTPREDFEPPVSVRLTGKSADDPILGTGIRTLRGLLKRQLNKAP